MKEFELFMGDDFDFDRVFSETTSQLIGDDLGTSLLILDDSDRKPDEWMHLVDESLGYEDVIHTLAYTVLRERVFEVYSDCE